MATGITVKLSSSNCQENTWLQPSIIMQISGIILPVRRGILGPLRSNYMTTRQTGRGANNRTCKFGKVRVDIISKRRSLQITAEAPQVSANWISRDVYSGRWSKLNSPAQPVVRTVTYNSLDRVNFHVYYSLLLYFIRSPDHVMDSSARHFIDNLQSHIVSRKAYKMAS